MKKVLFVATVVKQHIMVFHIPYLKLFKENGYEVHVCAKNDYEDKNECDIPYCDRFYDLPFERSPFKKNNFYVFKKIKNIINDNNYDIIHCHTPMGGVLTRLSAIEARKNDSKVIYTAHGFHFYKGAPLLNWLVYYPIERWLARYTDVLITINREDYKRAKKFKAKRVQYIPGVGIYTEKFKNINIDKIEKRKSIGVRDDNFMIISVGELNKNKNHSVIIKAISKLKNDNIKYIICGQGSLENDLKELSKELGIRQQVIFLGYRKDIPELMNIADVFAFPSYREGLSLSLMEAMVSGLPVVCSNIRGNSDLIKNGEGGYLVKPNDIGGWKKAIESIYHEDSIEMGRTNKKNIKTYELASVIDKMERTYKL